MNFQNSFCALSFYFSDSINEEFDLLISSLPFGESEKTRLLTIKNRDALRSSLSALLCLKALLTSAGVNTESTDLTLIREPNGKPRFNSLPLHFSISHSGGLAAVALSGRNIGIDVEYVDAHRNISAISKRFFSAEEHLWLSESNSPTEDFFSLWTKKEALAKLTGEGLESVCRSDTLDIIKYDFKEYSLFMHGRHARLSVCCEHFTDLTIYNPYKELKINELQN